MNVVGVGTDLVEVQRIRTALARTPSLERKLFTPAEQTYAQRAADPAQRYAVRFAAKEAAMKALGVGVGAVGWHDIEVIRTVTGAPELAITGRAAQLADELGVGGWKVSLSHTTLSAQAVVLALG